jgi:hypothetical protein
MGMQSIMAELVKNPTIQDWFYVQIKATCGDEAKAISEEAVQRDAIYLRR